MSFSDFLKGQGFVLIQWLYAIWQIARDTNFVNSVYYLCQMAMKGQLHFMFRTQIFGKDTNIRKDEYDVTYTQIADGDKQPQVIYISKKYHLGKSYEPPWDEFRKEYFDDASKRNINGVELIDFNSFWYTVKFNGSYYFCHQDILFEWAMYDIDKLILLKEVELIGNELVMGTVISKEEMFETMLSKEYHINELYAPCIFGKEYNISWNLRLSAFLATIPLLLQARGLANQSALCTLILIVVDIVRTPLLKLYELFMVYFTRAVKLWIFRKCKLLYIFFSWFSKRWAACDRRYGYAYYTTPEEKRSIFPVTTFVKFKNEHDCKFRKVAKRAKPSIESYGFQINNGIIHSAELSYGEHCLYVEVKEGFFVSSADALTILKYNYYSRFQPDMELLAKILNRKCNMRGIIARGLAKILEIEILKRGVATLGKILDQKREETKLDNLLQTAGNIDMKDGLPNRRGESDIMHNWTKMLQGTAAIVDITKDTDEILDAVDKFHAIAGNFGAHVVSLMATDVLFVVCRARKLLRVVLPLFEKPGDVEAALGTVFSMKWYRNRIHGKQEVMIRDLSGVRKELSATWQLYRAQDHRIKLAKEFGIEFSTVCGRGGSREEWRGSTQLARNTCLRILQRYALASSLERGMHPPKLEWPDLIDDQTVLVARLVEEYISTVFYIVFGQI